MNKNEIIWIYGSSAAGKETFINFIMGESSKEFIKRLEWDDKKIISCSESINWIAQHENDPRGSRRAELPGVISKLSQENTSTIILVKGQGFDLKNNRLVETKKLLPNEQHKIIFIDTDIDEIFERLKNKQWWEDGLTKDMVKGRLKRQLKYLYNLRKDFEIISISGSVGDNYKTTSLPK